MKREPYDAETQAWIDEAETHEETLKRRQRAKYLRHKERYKARARERYAADPEKFAARAKIQRARHADKIKVNKLAWERQDRAKHPEKYKAKYEKYKDLEALRVRGKKWREENPGKNAAKQAAYRAAKLQRTPPWADLEAIAFFYECCPAGCEVDHIVPLQGEIISGLHIAENLQWLPKSLNRSKSNVW